MSTQPSFTLRHCFWFVLCLQLSGYWFTPTSSAWPLYVMHNTSMRGLSKHRKKGFVTKFLTALWYLSSAQHTIILYLSSPGIPVHLTCIRFQNIDAAGSAKKAAQEACLNCRQRTPPCRGTQTGSRGPSEGTGSRVGCTAGRCGQDDSRPHQG